MEYGLQQEATVCLGTGKLRFQLAAQTHQFINLGNNAALFAERRERKCKGVNPINVKTWLSSGFHAVPNLGLTKRTSDCESHILNVHG
jgi:hypothetical protein